MTEFYTPEAEQVLLGSLLVNNDSLDQVGDFLTAEHFCDPVHRRIFEGITGRVAKGHLASPVTMKMALANDEGLKELGGPSYLARLAGAGVGPHSVRHYARAVVTDASRRLLSDMAFQAQEGLSGGAEPQEVALRLMHALQTLPESADEESSVSLLKAMTEAVADAREVYEGKRTFFKTGIRALDEILKGLAPGDFCLLGGATSMGKTSVALEIAKNAAFRGGQGVAFVSLEMTHRELATRIASSFSRVPYSALRDAGNMSEKDFRAWSEGALQAAQGALRIVPKHVRDVPAIHAACRRINREFGPGAPLSLVVIDYVQLARAMGGKRYEMMTEVSIQMKHMAGMLGVPVIGLVQLSRDIGYRDDKRPMLSDIKETGQLENDADQVIFCHREEYWLEREGPKLDKNGSVSVDAQLDWEADMAACKNKVELIVRKNRHGRLATAMVGCHLPTARFWDLAAQEEMAL
ncbi:AAA family ATPase [Pseudooceanicola sp. CBS1P-1]|uniref:DNA 5'-3' helicase n=1 Tax=Pseudooceanicola albus TaxID=2692189 RepID=A0A6L7G406_9RHOB|nr:MULTISPECIES: DnaB-like helicase C-terminal domain-containing protein [Pseudooceanicola]MBT9385494.1 AAA family ATPase [Pseudooceanicola endophyticus]MXN19094.1 AAA family ATPase [Pseudooceanicola albus]